MKLGLLIKNSLEKNFGVRFNVSKIGESSILKYKINLDTQEDEYFKVEVEIKNDTRLIIIAEPEKYGANFLSLINKSTRAHRELFVSYWDEIEREKNKINVKINDIPLNKKDFLSNNTHWKQFNIRLTKSPYFENNDEKEKMIVEKITLVVAMMLSLLDYKIEGYEEGNINEITIKKYERNRLNRELCVHVKGYKCACCGFEFKNKYGKIGEDFIEVHHIIPVSEMGENYIVDPINDLVPLCANCHSMIHRKNPPYTVEELKKIIEENNDINK